MSDIDKFHEWVESQSPLALREYTHAQAAWLARGELDAVRIKEVNVKAVNSYVPLITELQGQIAELTAKLDKETVRADAWVKAARDLARELGTPDEDSNGSIQDWKRITAKAKQVAELTAKLDKARVALNRCLGMDDYFARAIIEQALEELDK